MNAIYYFGVRVMKNNFRKYEIKKYLKKKNVNIDFHNFKITFLLS